MPIDDEPLSHPAPRFVPTLTEVVGPGDAVAPAQPGPWPEPIAPAAPPEVASPPPEWVPPAAVPDAPLPPGAVDRAAELLLARLAPELDRLVADTVARVLHEQMLGFNARVQKAVGELVREQVAKAVARGGGE